MPERAKALSATVLRSVLDQLSAQFNERLASLRAPDAAAKVAAVFKRKGRLSTRPKAGTAF